MKVERGMRALIVLFTYHKMGFSTAAEGPNFRGTYTGGTTFVHMSKIVLRDP